MKSTYASMLAASLIGALTAGPSQAAGPVSWGAPNPAKGCVIFRESEKFDVTSADQDMQTTAKSRFELQVLSADGVTLPKTTWPDDQSTLDQLQQMAIQDRVHFVKIKDPYTADELSAAQAICRQAMAPSG